ncbi:histidine phosphatase family protein [Glycomyces sp. TRM65418]|uniref:histidine phosphatase family protein n=1 Tax=Glycomyces sp. TRM65418 TaxID=2867006 RepID=UPI001CE606CE|nr:histidine phosphatase family protein [Glycomyces sp. TRM65418]MCC3762946.1 histidine phosphatase family protein [Glycomyces sp. TRM65418]QZD56970.1 histidine phosphatase family protein [Glycomyces sp. TRM65418]
MGEIVLIRHGETTWSASGQHTSVTDLDLTENGVSQAKALAPLLARWDFTEVWSSPRKRSLVTADLAGLEITAVVPDLAEWGYGDYEGRTSEEIREENPDWSLWTHGGKGPGGETPDEVAARLDRALAEAEALLDRGDVALVAHGHSTRVAAARWLGRPARDGREFTIDTASIAALGYEHGRHAIALWNLTPWAADPE